jgi:hypothetical protein
MVIRDNIQINVFIVFNCHKFSFFSFVNWLLTALKQNEQITNRCPRQHTFNVKFLRALEKLVKTVKSKCEIIFKRFGSFRDVVSNNKILYATRFWVNWAFLIGNLVNLVPRAIRKAQFTQKLVA